MTAIENSTLEKLSGAIYKLDLIDHVFNLFSRLKRTERQEDSRRSALLLNGIRSKTIVDGTELKAQFKHRSGYVVFTGNDCCDTEKVFISFLDFNCNLLDNLRLDRLFSNTGFASNFTIVSADEIEFSIYQEEKRTAAENPQPAASGISR